MEILMKTQTIDTLMKRLMRKMTIVMEWLTAMQPRWRKRAVQSHSTLSLSRGTDRVSKTKAPDGSQFGVDTLDGDRDGEDAGGGHGAAHLCRPRRRLLGFKLGINAILCVQNVVLLKVVLGQSWFEKVVKKKLKEKRNSEKVLVTILREGPILFSFPRREIMIRTSNTRNRWCIERKSCSWIRLKGREWLAGSENLKLISMNSTRLTDNYCFYDVSTVSTLGISW